MNKIKVISLFTLLVLLLTACPGGGGGAGIISNVKSTAGAGNIVVTWTYDAAKESEINAFAILRSPFSATDTKLGVIKKDVAKNLRTYTDASALQGTKYTYSVAIVDKNGNVQDTAAVKQSNPAIAPNPPIDENTPPVATDDVLTVLSGGTGTANVLSNDTDADDDTLSATAVADGSTSKGTYTITSAGVLSYTANAGTSGTDSVTYTVNDGNGGSDTGTVTITITTEVPDLTFEGIADLPLRAGGANTAVIDVHYAAGLPAGATVVGTPPAGLSAIGADGNFTYTGTGATFEYSVDGGEPGLVTITMNAAPTFESVSTPEALLNNTKDVIYIPDGTNIVCATNCNVMPDGQTIIGAGVDLTAADLGITDSDVTSILVAKTANSVLRSSTEQVLEVSGGATIKGLTIRPGTGGFGAGVFGFDSIAGDITVEDVDFIGGNYGIAIRETNPNNVDGGKYTLTVNNVTVTNPAGIGIFPGDADTVDITNTTITGAGTGITGDPAGAAIRVESEFTTDVTIDNVTIKPRASGTNAKLGIVIFKNNAFGHAATTPSETMTVSINNTSIEFLASALTDTAGVLVTIVGAAFDDVPPLTGDTGTLNISGTGTSNAESKKVIDNSTGTLNDSLTIGDL